MAGSALSAIPSGGCVRAALVSLGNAVDAANHQTAWIEQVLRLEMALRPLTTRLKLHPKKIADLPIHAVPDFAAQFAFRITDS